MTYQRFKQLYKALVIDRVSTPKPTIDIGSDSPVLVDALIKVANGDHSEFDRIQHLLAKTSV